MKIRFLITTSGVTTIPPISSPFSSLKRRFSSP
ncbi:unnamed protein product [Thlaspi arvense]|uniref:Uncharacterized protein n=1 Tax=Thlaspi arvense TaxID=13288 RepID=A0AAU9R6V7_THLAR|nr:unnamed protein product [Thlaspi arvense]